METLPGVAGPWSRLAPMLTLQAVLRNLNNASSFFRRRKVDGSSLENGPV